MTGRRDERALPDRPPAGLSGFPVLKLRATTIRRRAHRPPNGAWFFASDLSGRFDLEAPDGTCYLADTDITALREALGRTVSRANVIDEDELAPRVVSSLRLPATVKSADTTASAAANFEVTREINTVTPYSIPQTWAAGWKSAGFGGITYQGRFDPSSDARCLALFGPTGPASYPDDPDPVPALDVARTHNLPVSPRPAKARITVVKPPT